MTDDCKDKNCPVHGNLGVHGMKKTGKVISNKMKKTAVVELDSVKYFPKYKRWAKRKSKVPVHCPDCMNISVGDIVIFKESKKISKTKAWVITGVIKKAEVEQ